MSGRKASAFRSPRDERLLARFDFRLQLRIALQMIEQSCLDAAEAEIVGIASHFRLGEADRPRIPVRGKLVDDWAAGIAQRQHARDFVVGFAGSIVARAADARIGEMRARHSTTSTVT